MQVTKRGAAAPPVAAEPVKVSLHDCLACSGCITSAETVLLQHQSSEEFLSKLREPGIKVVVSVSPQSRAALAAFYGLTPSQTMRRLGTWLRSLGVSHVFDLSTSHDLSLLETASEFIARLRAAHPERCAAPSHHSHPQPQQPGTTTPMETDGEAAPSGQTQPQTQPMQPLPMLASACPGWICYAEKTHGDHVLPYISHTKSPQAVMGTLIKQVRTWTCITIIKNGVWGCWL